ncbi:MAG: hypothetical protein IJT77_06515 [Clostridia bacterium]|nr:hypothetical protein [Clostridia bacterium]
MSVIDLSVNGLSSLDYVNSILYEFPGKAMQATYRAAKRASAAGKTEARRYVTKTYNIKAGTFNNNTTTTIKVLGGGSGATKVMIKYSGQLLNLLEFKPKVSRTDGVRYVAKRGTEHHLRHAFDVPRYGGGIYERVGKPRFPIRIKLGPSTPHMLSDNDVAEPLGKRIMEIFNKRLVHEIDRILK